MSLKVMIMMIMIMMMMMTIRIIFRTFGGQCSLMLYVVIGLPLMMLFLAQVIINHDEWWWFTHDLTWLCCCYCFFSLQIGNLMADGIKTGYSRLACRQIKFHFHFAGKFTFTLLANLFPLWQSWWPICEQQIHFHFAGKFTFTFTLLAIIMTNL